MGKKALQEHGIKGVKQQTPLGEILRMSKGKAIPDHELTLGEPYELNGIIVRDVFHRVIIEKPKRNTVKA